MSKCLTERTLLSLYDGEATGRQRDHLKECEACSSRYEGLIRDLEAIGETLRQGPPPKAARYQHRSFTGRWLPAGAALAMALLLVWVGVGMWNRSSRPSLEGTTNGESRSILDELPSNPFLLTEALALELASKGADSYDLAAVILDAERPCEWYDLPPTGAAESSIETMEFSGGVPFAACVEISPAAKKR